MASKQTGQKLTSEPFSFGLKYKIVKKDVPDTNTARLEHTDNGHNKFYEIKMFKPGEHDTAYPAGVWKYLVTIKYGKIGTQGSLQKHPYTDEVPARAFFRKKMEEKRKKGYKVVSYSIT